MNENQITSQDIEREFSDITEMVEREQIKLTPEVQRYLHERMEAVLDKAKKGNVIDSDLDFLKDVRVWMQLPPEWQKDTSVLEGLHKQPTMIDYQKEADKREITLNQWIDLYMMVLIMQPDREADDKKIIETIDKLFKIENGRIIGRKVNLENLNEIYRIPKNMTVQEWFNCYDCEDLVEVPAGLIVMDTANFSYCRSLIRISESAEFKRDVSLKFCVNLEGLPRNFSCKKLYLSRGNLKDQVYEDAEILYKEGKIKEIKCDKY